MFNDYISRGSFDDYAITERWSIDAAVQRRKKHKQFCLQYRKCARSVDRIISSSGRRRPKASNVDLQTILFTSVVCRSRLGLDYTHGHRNPDVLCTIYWKSRSSLKYVGEYLAYRKFCLAEKFIIICQHMILDRCRWISETREKDIRKNHAS